MSGAEAGTVLALNSGSSSLKFGLYRVGPSTLDALLSGEAGSIDDAVARVRQRLSETGAAAPDAIGHRVVHGGPALRCHCIIDGATLRQLEAATPFAPLHTPAALAIIGFAEAHFPGVPQVACFDTAFHAGLPDVARVLPIARAMQADGVERYGFHGLSCESIVAQLGGRMPARLIIAHLGQGASVTAVRDGRSIDTSMGLTPSGGVMMGTRSGDLDPGVLVYLMKVRGLDAGALEALVDHRSGLLGVSGISSDMRVLHAAAASNPDARLAIAMFCMSVAKQVAAMIAALDGVDLLVFTGGIGENDPEARARICRSLSWIGVALDDARNDVRNGAAQNGAGQGGARQSPVGADRSRCAVEVLASQEDERIARHAWTLARQTDGG